MSKRSTRTRKFPGGERTEPPARSDTFVRTVLPGQYRLAEDPGVLLLPGSCLGAGEHFVRFGFGRAGFAPALEVFADAIG